MSEPVNVTYKGITHTCTDSACHVVGFIQTVREQEAAEKLSVDQYRRRYYEGETDDG